MRAFALVLGALALSACVPGEIRKSVAAQEEDRDTVRFGAMSFERIADGVWQHTAYLDLPGIGPVPSNGLLVVDGETSLLVDTAWTDAQTEQLLRWAAEVLGKPVRAAVVTHSHQDKMGGIGALHAAGVETWAHPLTNDLAPEYDFPPARGTLTFDGGGWATGAGAAALAPLRVYYPGGGHTRDNITVGLPGRDLAFGGCLIKDARASSLGNLEDADRAHYARAARNFGAAFPDASRIAMSHSPVGDRRAIARTVALAEEL